MKVILLQDIKSLGKKFDTKNVKNGYARNFLLPQKLARTATKETIKELEKQKAAWQKKEEEIKNKLEALAKEISEKEFKFALKIGKKGEVFGSIAKNDIKALICTDKNKDLQMYLQNLEINLDKPIKTLGEHQVEINLGGPARHASQGEAGKGVKTKIKVIIESA